MRRLLAAALVFAFVGVASLALAEDKPNPTGNLEMEGHVRRPDEGNDAQAEAGWRKADRGDGA